MDWEQDGLPTDVCDRLLDFIVVENIPDPDGLVCAFSQHDGETFMKVCYGELWAPIYRATMPITQDDMFVMIRAVRVYAEYVIGLVKKE